ncbi:MAG: Uncharacterised protein [Opitutia bacterium UBA7350]|nr:MAG: Uncharacterised protein [Opitutae bacterium UBA7350]
MSGYGEQRIKNIDVGESYTYDVKFYEFQYYYAFCRKEKFSMEFLLQPQYNTTKFVRHGTSGKLEKGYEFGCNLGLLFRKNFFDDFLGFYTLLSVGPHYVSGTPDRQDSGFIFSDNISVGMTIQLNEKTYLDIRPGIRHISKAGLTRSNGGINDLNLTVGFFRNL